MWLRVIQDQRLIIPVASNCDLIYLGCDLSILLTWENVLYFGDNLATNGLSRYGRLDEPGTR